jgi:hypothetical protein
MSERDEKEAGRLILSNFQMFAEALQLFYQQVEPTFLRAMDKLIEDVSENMGWHSDVDFLENGETWFCPAEWVLPDSKYKASAYFYLAYSTGTSDDACSLENLCGINGGVGFGFWVNPVEYGSGKKWSDFLKRHTPEINQALTNKGFRIDADVNRNGAFFFPFTLNIAELTEAWMNDEYDALLQPVADAMQVIESSLPVFEDLLGRAKQELSN